MDNKLPLTIVMITLNEGYHLSEYLEMLTNKVESILIVDSYSKDNTVDVALKNKVKIIQRKFTSFGDQWNFAINSNYIKTPWVMKLDPDERISDTLFYNLKLALEKNKYEGFYIKRRLFFLNKSLGHFQLILRVWKTGKCKFSNVSVNEYPIIKGKTRIIDGYLDHLDSISIEHWINKHNKYSSLEALNFYNKNKLSFSTNFFGSKYQRQMWFKKIFWYIPFKYLLLYLFYFFSKKIFLKGKVGFIWLNLRINYFRQIELKIKELEIKDGKIIQSYFGPGIPDPRVEQF